MGEHSTRIIVSPACYAVIYPQLVEIARQHGYALAIHGSMTRDFDLIAVPWIQEATDPLELAHALKDSLSAVFTATHFDQYMGRKEILREGQKPHGRMGCLIHLTDSGLYGPYLDITIMPRVIIKDEENAS